MGLDSFYRGRRVLVTGHTGFKGAWLAWRLLDMGAVVTGYALEPEEGRESLYQLTGLEREMKSVRGDLRDFASLNAIVSESGAEFVFHLAAEAIARRAYEFPMETFATNAQGTVHVLEMLRLNPKIGVAVLATTDKVYENNGEGRPFHEDDRLGGREPYGTSKAMAELAVRAYRKSYFEKSGQAVTTVRAGNVIGGGDFAPDRIIPDLVEAAKMGKEAVIRNPRAVRPWQHVLDALEGYLLLGPMLAKGGLKNAAFNFAPSGRDNEMDVEQLAGRFLSQLGRGKVRVEADSEGPWEAPALRLEATRAGRELGWKPHFDAGTAVDASAWWYRRWLEGEDPKSLVLQQIHEYPSGGK